MVSLVMTQEIKPNELRADPPTSSLDLWQEDWEPFWLKSFQVSGPFFSLIDM